MKKLLILPLILLIWSCDSEQDKAERFFLKGNEALTNGQYREAIRFYNEALALKSDYIVAYNNRGVAYYQDGKYPEAINNYSTILVQYDTLFPDALRNRANAYLADGRYERAISDLGELEEVYPDSAFIPFTKGIAFHEAKQYDEAISSFKLARNLDDDNAEILVNAANSYFMKGELQKANELLAEAELMDASEPNIYNTKGLIAMEQEDWTLAKTNFDLALKMDPGNPYYYNNRGFLNLQLDSLDAGYNDIRRAIIGDPNNAWAYRNRGILFYKQGRTEDALRNFELAQSMDERIPLLYYYWALTLISNNDNARACELIQLEMETSQQITRLQNNCR